MSRRWKPFALGLLGVSAGVALQLLVGRGISNFALFFVSLAAVFTLIVPVTAEMPARRESIMKSAGSRRKYYAAALVALLLGWVIFILTGMLNGVTLVPLLAGLALLAITTCTWFVMRLASRRDSAGEPKAL